ncbi:MAG TPA: hypothetical protein VE010_21120 [Thermoanaerobaculia bacterium]|nr:hypothetical protein [Thermoanaerobaculia bacterium]
MNLGIDTFTWQDLSSYERLKDLALAFDRYVEERDAELFGKFVVYRQNVQTGAPNGGLPAPEESALLIGVGRELGRFLTQMFGVDTAVAAQQARARRDSEVARFKRELVVKRVAKIKEPVATNEAAVEALIAAITPADSDPELALAMTANRLFELEKDYPRGAKEYNPSAETRQSLAQLRERLDASLFGDVITPEEGNIAAEAAAVHALTDLVLNWTAAQWKAGRFDGWPSFRLPQPMIFDRLVPTEAVDEKRFGGEHHEMRRRDGFHLTDDRMNPREITDEAHYCIDCHER